MALLMKRENWPLPEQQSANMVMCEENVSQLESGAQIAEAGEEDGKKRFSNEIEKEVLHQCFEVLRCLHAIDARRRGRGSGAVASMASSETAVASMASSRDVVEAATPSL